MRAKFVNEKFVEDSDPIKDLGIGMFKISFEGSLNAAEEYQQALKHINDAIKNLDPNALIHIETIKAPGSNYDNLRGNVYIHSKKYNKGQFKKSLEYYILQDSGDIMLDDNYLGEWLTFK